MIILNAKDSDSLRMNRHERLLSQVYIQNSLVGIRGIVHFELLKLGETVNTDLYCEQLDSPNQSSIEKYSAIINRKGEVLQRNNARPHCARKSLKKLMVWGGRYCPTYHTRVSLRQRISNISINSNFLSNKQFQNLDDMKNAISRYFRSDIKNLHTRWKKVVANEGNYIID
ncbi:histone-lysine N-methyltransferase SETMAR [Trichonephila clavipes]|uniref:Histone-lysine N-methyltransferase SETMAR n=1 Tax=Trichonephila clavipes TaxID=2585209 RepID=A0A8X6RIE1_TRICX|nr:histone-lysine N-methyltransferase SETMAR [Trichonephila clavipes]